MRRGKPWTNEDVIAAKFLRHLGLTPQDVGRELGRSAGSVIGKLGPFGQTTCYERATLFESWRPAAAKSLGEYVDHFTLGTA